MNLAIEYLTRSGELKSRTSPPYSLFLNHATITENKLVVTVHANQNKLIIKQWDVVNPTTSPTPSFIEQVIPQDHLFTSDFVIVPDYDLVWYFEDPYVIGKHQPSDPIEGESQQEEYLSKSRHIMNSAGHNKNRESWLWSRFVHVYNIKVSPFGGHYTSKQDQLKTIDPSKLLHWNIWRKYLLDFNGEVAGELLFQAEYLNKSVKEGRTVTIHHQPVEDSISSYIRNHYNFLYNYFSR
jgi:hypothetical protein